jgi:two-component system NtrC family sensor kinase
MKALLIASDSPDASSLRDAIRKHDIDIERVAPADVTVKLAAGSSFFVLFPSLDGADVASVVAACAHVRGARGHVALVLAIVHDPDQLEALVDAGADDFLLWPAEAATLRRRLQICTTRLAGMRDVTVRKRYDAQPAHTERLASLVTLAAGIAHEINNPLSYVIGNLVFALDNLEPLRLPTEDLPLVAEVRNALSEARQGAQRIASIVRDVKIFSRADRDTLKLVAPASVVEASLRMVQSNIENRATVVREINEVPPILANEAGLAQVMINLLMNAVHALPERPVSDNIITIAVRSEPTVVVMEVRDNGVGVAPEHLRHIFDPFFTTKPVGEGMGLGLSICNSIIDAHDGRIEVMSTVGVGSAFRVIIPLAPIYDAAEKKKD